MGPARLDEAAITASLELPEAGDVDLSALPAGPGVLILEPRGGPGTLLIATTANLRELARRRLCPDPEQAKGYHVDYRALTGRVLAVRVGSGLEADAVYLRQARERLPASYKAVSERWRAWFVHVDPAAEFPQFAKTNLQVGLVGKRSASTLMGGGDSLPPGVLVGPVPDKDAAGRLIEGLIDAFDLCRFHNLLVLAPKAQACAYKEMGRCPAPCDGSEGMGAYRERVRGAVEAVVSGALGRELERVEARMREAAGAAEFEAAGALKARADRLAGLLKPAFANVARLEAWRLLWILPSPERGRVRPVVFVGGELLRLEDVASEDPKAAAGRIGEQVAAVGDVPLSLTQERIDTVGLVSRWLFKPLKKRGGVVLAVREGGVDLKELAKAVRAVGGGKGEVEVEGMEVEG